MMDYRIVVLLSSGELALVNLGRTFDDAQAWFFAEAHEWFSESLTAYGNGLRALRYYIERWSPHPQVNHAGFWCRLRGLNLKSRNKDADALTTMAEPIHIHAVAQAEVAL